VSDKRILIIVTEEEAAKAREQGYPMTEAGAYLIDPANIVIPDPEPWPGGDAKFLGVPPRPTTIAFGTNQPHLMNYLAKKGSK
jgi:hypothetical protein